MPKIADYLFYRSLSSKYQNPIYNDIQESNRRSVIAYASISSLAFMAMFLFATLDQNAVSKNKLFYVIGTLVMLGLLLLNRFIAKKHPVVIHISAYLFVAVMFAIGIMLAVSSKEDVTASYMVFLFVTPLLFTLRPLNVIVIIIISDIFYILIMHRIQAPELFQKNIVNAVIYALVSIFVSTTMIRMRIQKFETDHMNRILMETDQLTGMLNRRSFAQHIDKLAEAGSVEGMKVCAFDVNGLKKVNDNIGHHAGDELLRGAAACLENVFSHYGHCYRTGGDEFMAILQDPSPTEEELIDLLNKQTTSFKGTYVPGVSISTGIVVGTAEDTISGLLRKADAKMYENKAAYYRQSGIDRRARK